MKRKKFREDIVIGLILIIFSTISFFQIYHILHKESGEEYGFSPATFPLITMGSIIFLSIGLFTSSLFKLGMNKKEIEVTERLSGAQVKQISMILLIMVFYIYMINLLGFYTSTIVINIVVLFILKVRNWIKMLVSSTILVVCIFLFFEKGMNLVFPRGWLF
jgi:putative tricarboxylic transport membrane protein